MPIAAFQIEDRSLLLKFTELASRRTSINRQNFQCLEQMEDKPKTAM